MARRLLQQGRPVQQAFTLQPEKGECERITPVLDRICATVERVEIPDVNHPERPDGPDQPGDACGQQIMAMQQRAQEQAEAFEIFQRQSQEQAEAFQRQSQEQVEAFQRQSQEQVQFARQQSQAQVTEVQQQFTAMQLQSQTQVEGIMGCAFEATDVDELRACLESNQITVKPDLLDKIRSQSSPTMNARPVDLCARVRCPGDRPFCVVTGDTVECQAEDGTSEVDETPCDCSRETEDEEEEGLPVNLNLAALQKGNSLCLKTQDDLAKPLLSLCKNKADEGRRLIEIELLEDVDTEEGRAAVRIRSQDGRCLNPKKGNWGGKCLGVHWTMVPSTFDPTLMQLKNEDGKCLGGNMKTEKTTLLACKDNKKQNNQLWRVSPVVLK
jgi:hypothetical protein